MAFRRAPRFASETPRPSTPRAVTPRPTTPRPTTPLPATPRAVTPRPSTSRTATPRAASATSRQTTSHSSQSKLAATKSAAKPSVKPVASSRSRPFRGVSSCQQSFAQLAVRAPAGATVADALPADALEHLASVADDWDFRLLSRCACVSRAWHAAFAPRLRSMPARLREAIEVLVHGELLRRPTMWRERRRLLLQDLDRRGLEEMRSLQVPPNGVAQVVNSSLLLAGLLHRYPTGTTLLAKFLADWGNDCKRALKLHRSTLATQLAAVDPATVSPRLIGQVAAFQTEDWFSVEYMAARSLACKVLIGWVLSIVEEAEFFAEWPEAKAANDELRSLRHVEAQVQRRVARVASSARTKRAPHARVHIRMTSGRPRPHRL